MTASMSSRSRRRTMSTLRVNEAATFMEPLEARTLMSTAVTGVTTLEGDATVVAGAGQNGGDAVRLVSQHPLDQGNTAGNVIWTPQTPVKWSELTTLTATFKGEIGDIAGGAPRFSVWLDWNNNGELDAGDEPNNGGHLFALWGDPNAGFVQTPTGDWETTINFADPANTGNNFEVGQVRDVAGVPGPLYDNYQTTIDLVGNLRVLAIGLILDAGWSQPQTDFTQQFLIDNVLIEGQAEDAAPAAATGARAAGPAGSFSEKLVGVAQDPGDPAVTALSATAVGAQGKKLKLAAQASDDGSVKRVSFYLDQDGDGQVSDGDVLLGKSKHAGANGRWNRKLKLSKLDAGDNTILAVARDGEGNESRTLKLTVTA